MKTNLLQKNIPKGWQEKSLGNLIYFQNGFAFNASNYSTSGKVVVRMSNISTEGNLNINDNNKKYIDIETYKQLPDFHLMKGDLVMCMTDVSKDFGIVGKTALIDKDGEYILNQRVGRIRPVNNLDINYLHCFTNSDFFLNKIHEKVTGSAQYNLSTQDIKNSLILVPPIKEQQKIAEILGTVDEDIAQTQKVIKATEKLKRGLMQQLFTRGIGHTKFKDTKIGQIPEAWGISLMAEKIDFQEGPGILAKDFKESGVPLIRLEGINSSSLLNGCNYLDQDLVAKKWAHFKLQKGDILLSSSASLGRVTVVNDEGIGAIVYTGIIRFRPKDASVSSDFIQSFLTSPVFQNQIGSHDTGSTIKHFGPSHLKKMWFVVPKVKEQKEIAEILSAVDEKNSVNKKLKEKLTLLKKGLMQDLLSGRVRTNI